MGLGESLFEKLMRAGLKPHMLAEQYRMHPAISAFPNRMFYDSMLKDGVADSDRTAALSTRAFGATEEGGRGRVHRLGTQTLD